MYRVEYGDASPGDLTLLGNGTLLVYEEGEWMKNVSVAVEDDDTPETDEPFYIVLFNATGERWLISNSNSNVKFKGFFVIKLQCGNGNEHLLT